MDANEAERQLDALHGALERARLGRAQAATGQTVSAISMGADEPGALTVEQHDKLVELGLLGKVELIENRLLVNTRWEFVFGPEQQRAAAQHGIRVRGVVDALLDDPGLLAELDERRSRAAHRPARDPGTP